MSRKETEPGSGARRQLRNKDGYLIGHAFAEQPKEVTGGPPVIFKQIRSKEGFLIGREPVKPI